MAKMMNLIDQRMMERMLPTAPVNPIHKNISELDKDMTDILQRSDMSDRDKVEQYNQVLQKYLDYYHKPVLPTSESIKTAPSPIEGELLRVVPKSMQSKAKALLDRINRDPNMSWNERGEFVYNNQTISGTNIVDLISHSLRHRKSFQAYRWQDFARALRQNNIPQELIGNQQQFNWMHRESATSDAFSTADEDEVNPARLHSVIKPRSRRQQPKRERQDSEERLPQSEAEWISDTHKKKISKISPTIKTELNWDSYP